MGAVGRARLPAATSACRSCGRAIRVVGHVDGCFPILVAHKCDHGVRCSRGHSDPACPLCLIASDARVDVLRPACIWCSSGVGDQARGKGCARCRWTGERQPEPGAMAEIRAGMADVWTVR